MEKSQKDSSAIEAIGAIELKNQGGFVVKLECYHKKSDFSSDWSRSGSTGDITLGFTKKLKLEELDGVNNGDIVTAYANVVLGKDKTGNVTFVYEKGNTRTARFTISGTTLDDELGFNGIV